MTGAEFREARRSLFYSKTALATEWGLARHTISRWERARPPHLAAYAINLMLHAARG